MKLRVNYIDNLRTMMIFLLIPYHLAMAYNIWGEPNYIFLEGNKAISSIVVFMSPWFMPAMFLLAGVSACFLYCTGQADVWSGHVRELQ